MEFTEEDLEHSLRNVSEDRRVRALETFRDLERRNALLKRDMDSFEDDLASMGVRWRASARSSVSQALDPDLWSTLPLELLHLVFAHLPLVDIIRLRALSTTWNRYVSGDMPGFTKVCAEVNPTLFGMIGTEVGDDDELIGVMLPGSGSSWHKYRCTPSVKGYTHTMHSGDGGLVCIVSFSGSTRQHPRIVVRNPLTCRDRTLPRLPYSMRSAWLWMVQLVMDRDLKCYRVLVLGCDLFMQACVFCSIAGKWRSAEASDGLVFGFCYGWESSIDGVLDSAYLISRLPCVYDCASGNLVRLRDEGSPWEAAGLLLPTYGFSPMEIDPMYALVKDRLFVLHNGVLTRDGLGRNIYNWYRICEYQARSRQPHWAKLREHRCGAFEVTPSPEFIMHLYACRGFLLVTVKYCPLTAHCRPMRAFKIDLAWVYEIASEKWREIDDIGDKVRDLAMFELQWDAVP